MDPKHELSWSLRTNDAILSVLLLIQSLITFVVIPLTAAHVIGPWLMDAGMLMFSIVCAVAYTNRPRTLVMLFVCMLAIVFGPAIRTQFIHSMTNSSVTLHETISLAAFCFNLLVTELVARHAFSAGPVTRHRILGAVFVYLNVAVLFSISYDMIDTIFGGAMQTSAGGVIPSSPVSRTAEFYYFSLTTITTCGYGDIVPVHPFARGVANLEAVFGQLFPATFVARLVALHLTHNKDQTMSQDDNNSTDARS